MNQLKYSNPELYNFMKKNWELYEKRKTLIPNKEYKDNTTGYIYSYEDILYKTLNMDYDLNLAYEVLQDIFSMPFQMTSNQAKEKFSSFSERLKNSYDDDIRKVGATYIKWLDPISEAYTIQAKEKGFNNAIAENTNNHIKTIIKIR